MIKSEFLFLFNKHLKRNPNPIEYAYHIAKTYNQFEIELENCREKYEISTLYKSDTSKPYKIAILLCGHVRNAAIIKSLEKIKYNHDVFVFTWDNIGYRGDFQNTDIFKEKIEKLIENIPNIKKHKIENNVSFIKSIEKETLDKTYFNYSSPETYIKSQLYSICKSYEIFENYCKANKENYDAVFKFRFDTKIENFSLTEKTKTYIRNKTIFVTNDDCHSHPFFSNGCTICNTLFDNNVIGRHVENHCNNICDFFAYGDMNAMKKYCSMYHNYDLLNAEFAETNYKALNERPHSFTKVKNNYNIKAPDFFAFYKCSYPESILQYFLKDHCAVNTRDVIVSWDTASNTPLI